MSRAWTILTTAYCSLLHTFDIAAVLKGLCTFVELIAEVHLPDEAEDGHIAVVDNIVYILVRMHLTEAYELIAETIGDEKAHPHQYGGEALPAILHI